MDVGARVTIKAFWSELDGQEGVVTGYREPCGKYFVYQVEVSPGKTGWFVDAELAAVTVEATS
jgi:hypothetical protein